jgi:hypothetical protein
MVWQIACRFPTNQLPQLPTQVTHGGSTDIVRQNGRGSGASQQRMQFLLKLKSLSVVKILFWKFPCSLRWQAQAVEHEHNSFDLCSKLPLQHCRHEDHHRHILGCCRNVQSGGHPFVFVQSDGNPFAFVQSDGNPFILAVQSDGNTFVFLAVRHPDGNTINSLE